MNEQLPKRTRGCFACVNSGQGFVSYFDELLKDVHYLYVIKGGPGTGKSGLMAHIAACAEARGEPALRIYCSSDPNSLDGVLLPARSVALVDGTAPHSTEPSPPGAAGELVDLGQYWNTAALRANAEKIGCLNAEKSAAYARAYLNLGALEALRTNQKSILRAAQNEEGIARLCARLARFADLRCDGSPRLRQLSAIGMLGSVRIHAWETDAKSICTLPPFFGAEELIFERLFLLCGTGQSYSLDALTRVPDRIYSPAHRALLRCGEALDDARETVCALRRLFDLSDAQKAALRQYDKASRALWALTTAAFEDASRAHFALEKIYGAAMDFACVNALKIKLSERIFGAT